MKQVEVYRSPHVEDIERAQRFLRNAHAVRVRATQQRGADRFAGPSVEQDRPRPRHRDHRLGRNPDDRP